MDELKSKMNVFVGKLSPDECREQLVLAYLQMERCQQVLRGEDVEPVTMMDNGISSDLELFYQCKKAAEELDYLNTVIGGETKWPFVKNKFDDEHKKILADCYRNIAKNCGDLLREPSDVVNAVKNTPGIKKVEYRTGDKVYYWNGTVRECYLDCVEYSTEHGWGFVLSDGTVLRGSSGVFKTREDLVENLKKTIYGTGEQA